MTLGDHVEALLLYGEEALDAIFLELLDHGRVFEELGEVSRIVLEEGSLFLDVLEVLGVDFFRNLVVVPAFSHCYKTTILINPIDSLLNTKFIKIDNSNHQNIKVFLLFLPRVHLSLPISRTIR